MKCFHHIDADGYCAAFWVYKRYPFMKPEDFIPINYGIDKDWLGMIKDNEPIFIVDFSFEPDYMKKILQKTKDVIWIDHHISAIKKYYGFGYNIEGIRSDGTAACKLTHDYLFPNYKCPLMTEYIADYDVWKYEFKCTRYFKLGLDAEGLPNPTDSFWESLLEVNVIKQITKNGLVIEKYRNTIGNTACEASGFEYELNGAKLFCCNIADAIVNSEWFGDRINQYDAVCNFSYDGKENIWTYSFYSASDTDVSELVQSVPNTLSAGGHKKAAGLQHKEFIFKR